MKATRGARPRIAALLVLALAGSALGQPMQGELTKAEKKKTFPLKAEAGKVYAIDMISNEFDTYLWLQDAAGKELAKNDDGGENVNARLVFQAPAAGEYKIIAGSFQDKGKGKFTLIIQTVPEIEVGKTTKLMIDNSASKDKNILYKTVVVQLKENTAYKLELTGEKTKIDPILGVKKVGAEKLEALDDDSGGFPNAKLLFTPKSSGLYEVLCGSLGAKEGEVTLSIQAAGGAK